MQHQQRLLIIGTHHIFSARKKASALQIQRQAHLYDLDYYGHDPSNNQRLLLKFKDFELTIHELSSQNSLSVLNAVHHAIYMISYQFPEEAMARVPSRTRQMMNFKPPAVLPAEGHTEMYDANPNPNSRPKPNPNPNPTLMVISGTALCVPSYRSGQSPRYLHTWRQCFLALTHPWSQQRSLLRQTCWISTVASLRRT